MVANPGYLLLFGVLIGMRHALEADHVAAIASLSRQQYSLAYTIRQGMVWGLGHSLTLLLFGSIVIFMDTIMPEYLANRLEMMVGAMLVLLGIDLLRRMIRDKIHFHRHQHRDGHIHFHAHSHLGESLSRHQELQHDHQHREKFPLRALIVGLMHGMAGSAAVILLTLDIGTSALQGIIYILCFGMGSIAGMALLSVAISFPLRLFSGQLTWAYNLFQLLIGVLTISLGVLMLLAGATRTRRQSPTTKTTSNTKTKSKKGAQNG